MEMSILTQMDVSQKKRAKVESRQNPTYICYNKKVISKL